MDERTGGAQRGQESIAHRRARRRTSTFRRGGGEPSGGRRGRRRRVIHRLGTAASILAATVVVLLVACVVAYRFPQIDVPSEPVDVVYVIGPATGERVTLARNLVDSGAANVMLVSAPQSALEENQRRYSKCNLPGGDVICFSPLPRTTEGEAMGLAEMSEKYGWDSVIVITQTAHVLRTRVLMDRCFSGDVYMQAADGDMTIGDWLYQFAYQTGAFAKVITQPAC